MPYYRKRLDRTEKTIDGCFTINDWIRHNQKKRTTFYSMLKSGKILQVVIPVYSKAGEFLRNRRCYVNTADVAYVLSLLPSGTKKKLKI